MKYLEQICMIVIAGFICVLLYEGILLLRETRTEEDRIAREMASWDYGIKNDTAQIAAAAKVIAQIGAEERAAFAAQQSYYVKLGQDADATFGEINDETMPRINSLVADSDSLVRRGSSSMDAFSAHASGLLDTGEGTIEAAREPIAIIGNDASDLRQSIQNANQVTANLAATTGDIKTWVHRETTPVRGTWNVIKAFLMEFAGPGAQVATAIK